MRPSMQALVDSDELVMRQPAIRDTLDWARGRPDDHEWRAGLTPEREAAALALRP